MAHFQNFGLDYVWTIKGWLLWDMTMRIWDYAGGFNMDYSFWSYSFPGIWVS